jgi:hypothetical protein
MKHTLEYYKGKYAYYTGTVSLDGVILDFDFRVREDCIESESFVNTCAKSSALEVIAKRMIVEVN